MNKLKRCQVLLLLISGVLSAKSMDITNKLSPTTPRKSLLKGIADATAARKVTLETPVVVEETKAVVVQKLPAEPVQHLAPLVLTERVLACTQKIEAQTIALQPLLSQQKLLKAQQYKNVALLLALSKRKEPIETEMKKLKSQQAGYGNEERQIVNKRQAACRLLEARIEFAMHEPALERISKQQLTPVLFAILDAQKKELSTETKKLQALWKAKNAELNPLIKEEKEVTGEKDKLSDTLLTLEQEIAQADTTRSRLEAEKDDCLRALEQQLTAAKEDKLTIQDEISALKPTIAEEKDTNTKIELRKKLAHQERTLKACTDTIAEIEQAVAKAQGKTGGFSSWFSGK